MQFLSYHVELSLLDPYNLDSFSQKLFIHLLTTQIFGPRGAADRDASLYF